jgi:hypothetical protein
MSKTVLTAPGTVPTVPGGGGGGAKKYKHNNKKLEKEDLHEIKANFPKKINSKGLPYHAPAMQHMVWKK